MLVYFFEGVGKCKGVIDKVRDQERDRNFGNSCAAESNLPSSSASSGIAVRLLLIEFPEISAR